MTVEELIAMLEMQEEILQFNHFTNEDAWELGNIMVAEARRRKMPVVISIRLNNGYTVFQYAGDGTNLHNENWLRRKFNTVKTLEKSSLYTYMLLRKNEETMENLFLDEKRIRLLRRRFPGSGGRSGRDRSHSGVRSGPCLRPRFYCEMCEQISAYR